MSTTTTTLDTVTEDFLFSNRSWITSLIPSFERISFESQEDGSFHYIFEDAILVLGDKCIAVTKKGDPCKNNIKENLKCNRHQQYEPIIQKQIRVQISDCDTMLRPIPATVSWQDVLINGENVVKKDGTIVHMPVSAVWDATPYYLISLDNTYDNTIQEAVETYVIDRRPQGLLNTYVEEQNIDTCGQSNYMNRPRRYALKLPDDVKAAYLSPRSRFVDSHTLPGFVSWLAEKDYDVVDLEHLLGPEHGFWITYTGSAENEFRARSKEQQQGQQKSRQQRQLISVKRLGKPLRSMRRMN
jgi:hypothetical protein